MPIQIPSQGTGSKLIEKSEGAGDLNFVGPSNFQSFLASTDKTDSLNSVHSTLSFAKSADSTSVESFSKLDLNAPTDLSLYQFEAESANAQSLHESVFGNTQWPVISANEVLPGAFVVADLPYQSWQTAQPMTRQSAVDRHRSRAGAGNRIKLLAATSKSSAVSSSQTEMPSAPQEPLQKPDFVMVNTDASQWRSSEKSTFADSTLYVPLDALPSQEHAAVPNTKLTAGDFSVDTPLPVQSESSRMSVDGSLSTGLYSYVGPAAVQNQLVTNQLLRKHLLSQAAHAINTRYRQDGSKQTVTLELNPVELGHLKIQIEQDGEKIRATIIASEATTKEILTDDHQQLLQKLRELNVGDAEVEIVHSTISFNDETSQFDSPDNEFASNSTVRVGINLVA